MIKKKIQIGDKVETFTASAATPLYYRRVFGEDMLGSMTKLDMESPDVLLLEQIAFAMTDYCKNGESMEGWLEQFELMALVEALPDIISLIADNSKTLSSPSPKKAKATGK